MVVCEDDGYIKTKLSVVFQVLTELKRVLKEDDDLDNKQNYLELNVTKTSVLPNCGWSLCLFSGTSGFVFAQG